MTAKPTRTINQTRGRNPLDKAAGGCGGALNSFLVFLGDKGRPYATGRYSFDLEVPIVHCKAPSVAQKRNSNKAADGTADAHGTATPGEDRAMSVQREETAFMTLICHECAAATASPMGNSVSP